MNSALLNPFKFEIDAENLPIRAEQIRARLQSYPLMISGQMLTTLLLISMMWDRVAHDNLLAWLGFLVGLHSIESYYFFRYRTATTSMAECVAWRNRFIVFTSAVGLAWGIGVAFMFVPDDLAYQALLICVVLGVAAGGVTINPVFPPSLYIFVLLLILPMLFINVWAGDRVHFILAGMLLVYLGFILNAGRELAHTFEQSLRGKHDNRRLVAQLTAEKQRAEQAWQQAEQASVMKSRFLAAASHDLRQPMHALTLFIEAMRPQLQTEQGKTVQAQAAHAAEILGGMFDALLDLSKLDAGVVKPQPRLFELQDILDSLRLEFDCVAQQKGLHLEIQNCDQVLYTDPDLLLRILRNLLANALRYTEIGEVRLGCVPLLDGVQVTVSDSGIGIAPDHLAHIFEEYYQVGNGQRDRNKGLGLGLAIVQRLEQLLGYQLQVSSILGAGTQFTMLIPVPKLNDMMEKNPMQQAHGES